MAVLQRYYVKKDEAVTAGASDQYTLPRTAPLVGLILSWDIATTASTGSAAAADDAVIEVIKNGSEVIDSVTYGELVAVNQLLGYRDFPIADLGAGVSGTYAVFVPFGFGITDRKHFLPPEGFSSLDLKLTEPSGVVDSMTLNVVALRLLGAVGAPSGYLKISTKKAYTAAAAVEYIEMDRAHPYAAILLGEMDGTSTDIASVLTHLKVNIDAGTLIPIDGDTPELLKEFGYSIYPNPAAAPDAVAANHNFIPLLFGAPWESEDEMLMASSYGSVYVEATGAGAGSIRVTGVELVK